MKSLRQQALGVLVECNAQAKAGLAQAASLDLAGGATDDVPIPAGVPGRPERPTLVPHTQLKPRSVSTIEGRAALIHALAHIELNAIDLAADATCRFAAMPDAYYRDWTIVMREEALHFTMLCDHLATLGHAYGDFPAHNALWEMAERTKDDLLARIAIVPRTMEARGLDASPAVRAKLASVGDRAGAAIVDRILADEVGHVLIGNRWFNALCAERGLDPLVTAAELSKAYDAPRVRGPFNRDARRAAGFSDAEIAALDER